MKKQLLSILVLIVITSSLSLAQNSKLWGMTIKGGKGGVGSIFQTDTTGSLFKNNYSFYVDASHPEGNVIQASNGLLYGMSYEGGVNNEGVIFSYNISTGSYTDIYDFGSGIGGSFPTGSLLQVNDSLFYGLTVYGGTNNDGVIFSYNIVTGTETDMHDFGIGTDGQNPYGSLIQANNDLLYGMTGAGGANNSGIIFAYNISLGMESDLHDFGSDTDGQTPYGSLMQANDSLLYGVTEQGGANGFGIIFSYNISKGIESDLYDFNYFYGGMYPFGSLIQTNDSLLYGMTNGGGSRTGVIFSYNILSNQETDLHDFGDSTDGQSPFYSSLIKASNGLLYGMTAQGGTNGITYGGYGIIFCYNTFTGIETDLHDFGNNSDGKAPLSSLMQASNGLIYGMTAGGGMYNNGTIFSYNISTDIENNIHDLGASPNGYYPLGSLFQASNGLLYGITENGGINNNGIIFSYNLPTGVENEVYNFYFDSGAQNYNCSLIQANNGLLYGVTEWGGFDDISGIIFSYNISTDVEIDLHGFGSSTDGLWPSGSLIQAKNSLLYGMTSYGGTIDSDFDGDGTIFSYNISTGIETDLHNFGSGIDGVSPYGSLVQANNGLLYGMTTHGGVFSGGIIFSYNISNGIETVLHAFDGPDGAYPNGSLIQASNGLLYGMTTWGGTDSAGTFFSYNISTNTVTDLHDFSSGADGWAPNGSLIQASNGLLYGTTVNGGANDSGIIFSYDITTGNYTDIHDFTGMDGMQPMGNLIEVDSPFITTSVNKLPVINNQFSIYPNPTSGQFTIKSNGNQNGCTLEVYNVIGEKVYQSTFSNLQKIVNLGSQPPGMYFVYLKSEEGVEIGKVILTK